MKIDLHVHSSDRSACGKSTDEEQVQAAIDAGLDVLYFTDHHAFIPVEKLQALNRQYAPFRIFGGIEISINFEDFLVLGVQEEVLVHQDWQYPDLHRYVREHKGFIILAHPFRYHPDLAVDCETYRPDAIEIFSLNTPVAEQARIQELADAWGIPTLSNSDAHASDKMGSYYNIVDETPADEQMLFEMLRARRFQLFIGRSQVGCLPNNVKLEKKFVP
jgi:predicted metal-dependent phosphoesterase TrpH